MKQVRFTSVVQQSGKPEVYLLLIDPQHDADFQKALKANRIMTLQRGGAGGPGSTASKTDFGMLGYSPGPRAQVLLFPRALKIPDDAHVIGINYDLLDEEHEPAKEEPKPKSNPEPKVKTAPPKPKLLPKPNQETKATPSKPTVLPKPEPKPHSKQIPAPAPPKKVLPFSQPESAEQKEESPDVKKIKTEIRKALRALEAGKQVAAFNILKHALDKS